jgi:hypothetical protein
MHIFFKKTLKPSVNNVMLRSQKEMPQTEPLHISVKLLSFSPFSVPLCISFYMSIFSIHMTVRSDKIHFGLVDIGLRCWRGIEQWEASSSITLKPFIGLLSAPHYDVVLTGRYVLVE